MSDDLISRQAAIELITENSYLVRTIGNGLEEGMTLYGITQALNEVPSVRRVSAEPKTGRWREVYAHRDDDGDILRDYECTNCLGLIQDVPDADDEDLPRYCGMCGARMEVGET